MPLVIRLRRGTVVEVLDERPGAIEVSVQLDEDPSPSRAIVYPDMVGPVASGDRVLLNTTAVALGLGTGGLHFVVTIEGSDGPAFSPAGRVMKLRYTPQQVNVAAVEEADGDDRHRMDEARGLDGTPVVWLPLHSMLGPAAAGARAAGAATVVYVMTGGAALPMALSRLVADLRRTTLLDAVVTAGQAFGGDLEAVSTFSGLLAARHVLGADVVLVGDGPGNTGTGTTWGATDVESAMALNAASIVGGRPIAALRISFADARERHQGVSHHSITALGRVALVPVQVAVPVIEDEGQHGLIWDALRESAIDRRHQLVEVTGQPGLDLLAERGLEPGSMGRSSTEDPVFFLAAAAAGVLAGRMAAADRAWKSGDAR
jgi:hypothetical protein